MYPSSCRMHRVAWMVRPSGPSCALQRSNADDEVQVQEQLRRRALVARATALGRTVNIQQHVDSWKCFCHRVLRLCHTAVRALWHSSRAHSWRPQPCPTSLVLAIACLWVAWVQWLVIVQLMPPVCHSMQAANRNLHTPQCKRAPLFNDKKTNSQQ